MDHRHASQTLPRTALTPFLRQFAVALLVAVTLVGGVGCRRSGKARPKTQISEEQSRPREEMMANVNASPTLRNAVADGPEESTRTAADDIPCDVTGTWMRYVMPSDETPADWERPQDQWHRERALAILLTADRVRGPSVGPKGRVPPQVSALVALSKEPDVVCSAVWLLKRATLPGRIYALGALWLGDRRAFEKLSVDYARLPSPVPVTFGVVEGEARAADLVARLASGDLSAAWYGATQPLGADEAE